MALRSALRKAGQPSTANVQAWNSILGQYRLPELVSSQSLHSSQRSSAKGAKGRFGAEQGKEQQAKTAKAMQRVLPEVSTRPTRTPEELADASARAKEYSRQCMRAMRAFQSRQKERTKLRDDAIVALPVEHKLSALTPVQENWPMKMLPPFATPPKAPKWRF